MLTGIVLTHNNENLVKDLIDNLSFCDEIILFDNASDDNTQEIGKKAGARIIKADPKDFNNYSARRNKAMELAKNNWVLFIDSDEIVSEELKKELLTEISNPKHDTYYLRRRDYFWGKELRFGETSSARNKGIIRLMKKDTGKWRGRVHERFIASGSEGRLDSFINHAPHSTIASFLHSINRYSSLRADELYNNKHKTNIFEVVFFPFGKFFYTYIFKLGLLDGAQGFVYSFMMSFHSFLVRSKLYLKQN